MQMFNYKPALLGARCEVKVSPDGAEMTRGSKQGRVRFADVTVVRVVEVSARTSSTSLVLLSGQEKFVIQLAGLIRNARTDKESEGFARACTAIFEALGKVKPDAPVSFGGGPGLRWTMFMMGLVIALMCGALALAAFFEEGADMPERWFPGLMLVLLGFGGVVTALSFNPFRKPADVTPAVAAEIVRSHLPQ